MELVLCVYQKMNISKRHIQIAMSRTFNLSATLYSTLSYLYPLWRRRSILICTCHSPNLRRWVRSACPDRWKLHLDPCCMNMCVFTGKMSSDLCNTYIHGSDWPLEGKISWNKLDSPTTCATHNRTTLNTIDFKHGTLIYYTPRNEVRGGVVYWNHPVCPSIDAWLGKMGSSA